MIRPKRGSQTTCLIAEAEILNAPSTPHLQDFESEFVEILNQQCFRFLYQKLERARESPEGPLSTRNISLASSREVLKYISELGISKVALRVEDIEAILVCRHLNNTFSEYFRTWS